MTRILPNGNDVNAILFLLVLLTSPLIGISQFEILYNNYEILKEEGYGKGFCSLKSEFDRIDKSNQLDVNIGYQSMMTFYSFLNEKDSSLRYEFLAAPYLRNEHLSDYSKLTTRDAGNYIKTFAESKRIIFFNEKHSRSTSREFVASMLIELKALGYNVLALEDLNGTDESLNLRGYPIKNSGFYIVEYNYANLIRLAKSIGIEVIPYHPIKSNNRSEESFLNIKNYLSQNPACKMIILGGYGAIYKETTKTNEPPRLGTLLSTEYGDSLMSIDCITFIHQLLKSNQSPLYNFVQDSLQIEKPSVLFENESLIYPKRVSSSLVDFPLYLPKNFTYQLDRKKCKLKRKNPEIFTYEVYLAHEFKQEKKMAIPVFLDKIIDRKYEIPKRKGDYIIILFNDCGERVSTIHKKIIF